MRLPFIVPVAMGYENDQGEWCGYNVQGMQFIEKK